MAATNFKTENNTLRKLLGNGLSYRIPRFQRDYSWGEEEWEDLWTDLIGMLAPDGEPAHYLGYLVLQSSDDKTFDVIDGQQRLTTVSLLVLAVLNNLTRLITESREKGHLQEAERNQQRVQQIRQSYIGYLDPVTLVARSKLTLNRNNNDYYQNYLVPLGSLPRRGLRASEHLLRKAFEWFDQKVASWLKDVQADPGRELAWLVEEMSDRFFFTVITVTDELNAYKVFETLNARGVRLSATDLLKNYLFSVLDRAREDTRKDHELRNLEERWESMVGRLQAENFPDFLRVHWNSRHSFTRQSELFKTIRGQVASREQAFTLLRALEEDLDTYLALTAPESSDLAAPLKAHLVVLRTFNVRQPFPLLLAAFRVFGQQDLEKLLKATVVISMRFNVIGGRSTGEQETTYNTVARRITRGELPTLRTILETLRPIYPNDQHFRAAFAEKTIRTTQSRNNRVVRYILCALEERLAGTAPDFNSDHFTVEHILPQHPDDAWDAFTDAEVEALTYRLGNMTLLVPGENRDLGRLGYDAKRPRLQASTFALSRRVAEQFAEWTPAQIGTHQQWMAKQAADLWRIPQLS